MINGVICGWPNGFIRFCTSSPIRIMSRWVWFAGPENDILLDLARKACVGSVMARASICLGQRTLCPTA